MPWFKVDDGFHGHPKVVELSLSAVGLWTVAGSWSAKYLTDGAVPDKTIVRLGGTPELAAELVAADLWIGEAGSHLFKSWSTYQPMRDEVEAERFAAQERMKKVRAAKKGVRANDSRTTGERSDEHRPKFGRSSADVRVAPSLPSPIPFPVPSLDEITGKKPSIRLPKDWAPTAAHLERAKTLRVDVVREAENFRGHSETHDRHAANWNAAFTTWLGKAKQAPVGKVRPQDEWMYR